MPAARLVLFRDASQGAVLDAAAAKAVALLHASYVPAAAGSGLDLQVYGISKGVSALTLRCSAGGQSASISVTPDAATGLVSGALSAAAAAPGSSVALELAEGSSAVRDRVAFVPGEPPLPGLPGASLAGAALRAPRFLGGNADRIVRSRFLTPLYLQGKAGLSVGLVGLYAGDGQASVVETKRLQEAVRTQLTELERREARGELSLAGFLQQRTLLYARTAAALARSAKPARGAGALASSPAGLLAQLSPRQLGSKDAPRTVVLRAGVGMLAQSAALYGPVRLTGKGVLEAWQALLGPLLGQKEAAAPIGVLFDDRVRFQPAGLLLGEEVATLSLAPGEEVQVRQTVETKRRAVLEDVRDHETERQFTLSSSWSTDITAALQETDSQSSTGTLGAQLGADLASVLPIPVSVGGSASTSASQASTVSAETSRTDHLEATATASARLRAQHKVRLEVTTEDATSLASTRTLRNANPLRGVTYVFYKVYRKERVTLERYRARLCLALEVKNPARDSRAAFLEGVRKLDPEDPANYRLQVPRLVTATWKVELDGALAQANDPVSHEVDDDTSYTTQSFKVPSRKLKPESLTADGLAVDPAYMLTEAPELSVVRFKNRHGSTRYGAQDFEQSGGSARISTPLPQVRAQDPSIALEMVIETWGPPDDDGPIHDVEAEVTSRWGPTDTDALAYAEAVAQERERLRLECTLARVQQLRDVAVAQYGGTVLSRAVERYFRNVGTLDEVADIFDVADLYVRSTPHWATAQGRRRYRELRAALQRLPVLLTDESLFPVELTSSNATVFLPVREGRERDALALLQDFPESRIAQVKSGLEQLRAAAFAPVARQPVGYDEVTSPLPPPNTPMGSNAWLTEWETPLREFQVLGQWSEVVPTDGLHLEMFASDSTAADEARRRSLEGGGPS